MAFFIHILPDAWLSAEAMAQVRQSTDDFGAEVSFTGYVRQHDHDHPISHLLIEHYPQVTEAEIARIIEQALQQWQLTHVVVVHRVGKIAVGEPIVWVLTQARHRLAAYAANEFIMDYLKVSAPFWKKECFDGGAEQWVAAKQSDQDKYDTWTDNSN